LKRDNSYSSTEFDSVSIFLLLKNPLLTNQNSNDHSKKLVQFLVPIYIPKIMKNAFPILTFILSILTLTHSCKKDKSIDSTKTTINVSIMSNETYQYDLGEFGDEEGVSISVQASYFQVSKVERVNYEKMIYTYTPTQNYVGTDEVELKAERSSDGAGPSDKITIVVIKFTITN